MAANIPEYELKEFMVFLKGIQRRMDKKYGAKTVYKWRQKRLERDNSWI